MEVGERERDEGAHLGQFHGLSRGGGRHFSDSGETGDIFTGEVSGEERGPNDCRLISAAGCKSDPRLHPLIFFSTQPIESIPGRVRNRRPLLTETTNRYKR